MGRQKVRCGMAGHGAGCLVQSGDGDDVGWVLEAGEAGREVSDQLVGLMGSERMGERTALK